MSDRSEECFMFIYLCRIILRLSLLLHRKHHDIVLQRRFDKWQRCRLPSRQFDRASAGLRPVYITKSHNAGEHLCQCVDHCQSSVATSWPWLVCGMRANLDIWPLHRCVSTLSSASVFLERQRFASLKLPLQGASLAEMCKDPGFSQSLGTISLSHWWGPKECRALHLAPAWPHKLLGGWHGWFEIIYTLYSKAYDCANVVS